VAGAIPRSDLSFTNAREYRRALLESRGEELSTNTLEHLLSFALDRGMASTDAPEIARLARVTGENGNGLRTVLQATIESPLFRLK